MMSPSISDTKPKMATTCEQKEEKNKHQHKRNKIEKHLEKLEVDELRV